MDIQIDFPAKSGISFAFNAFFHNYVFHGGESARKLIFCVHKETSAWTQVLRQSKAGNHFNSRFTFVLLATLAAITQKVLAGFLDSRI